MSTPARCLFSVGIAADAPVADPQVAARVVALADAAGVDLLVLGEWRDAGRPAAFDPLIVAAWMAARTEGVGLVAALSALHCEPFHVARALSALDFLSAGRSGWMPQSRGVDWPRYGDVGRVDPAQELPKAIDFIAATESLWDSWDSDALIIDAASGAYLHPERVRRSDHRGPFHQVQGPLNAARPPQGHPLRLVAAGDPLAQQVGADLGLVRSAEPARNAARALLCVEVRACVGANLDRLLRQLADSDLAGLHLELADVVADLEWLVAVAAPQWRERGLIDVSRRTSDLRSRVGLERPPTPSERARAGVRP